MNKYYDRKTMVAIVLFLLSILPASSIMWQPVSFVSAEPDGAVHSGSMTNYLFETQGDSVSYNVTLNGQKNSFSWLNNFDSKIVEGSKLSFTTDLPVSDIDGPYPPVSLGPTYQWVFPDVEPGQEIHSGISFDPNLVPALFTPDFSASRTITPNKLEYPGGTQTITLSVTPQKSEFAEVGRGIVLRVWLLGDNNLTSSVVSVTWPTVGETESLTPSIQTEQQVQCDIGNPRIGITYTLVVVISIGLKEGIGTVEYKPYSEVRDMVSLGPTQTFYGKGNQSFVTESGTWKWNTTSEHKWLISGTDSIMERVIFLPFSQLTRAILIRSDGSIEPSTAPIQNIGDVYTFTANIYDSIIVERDNIVVDGAGYTVQKTGSDTGITLQGRNNVTIQNAVIRGFGIGIGLYFSNRCNLYGNRIEGNSSGPGIAMSYSEYNKVLNNTLSNNGHGIMLTKSSNNIIDGNNASYNVQGISMGNFCNNNTIAHNVANYNNGGLLINDNSSNNLVIDNEFNYNKLTGIMIAPNSCENVVSGNTIVGNNNGIDFWGNSSSNIIYHNNFMNNAAQAPSMEPLNIWDNGAEGNYWSDYKGLDSNGDGIGDTLLPHLGIDNFPLVQLWSEIRTFNAYVWKGITYQIITQSNNTIAAFDFSLSTKQISFNVTGPAGKVGYCNITIQKALLQGNPYQVSMDEKTTSNVSITDTTHETFLCFIYNLTTHRVKIIGTQVLDIIPPLADAGPNQTVNEDTVITLDGSGSYDNVDIVNYTWTFFDVAPKTLTRIKPTYTFNTPGKYIVTLNVTDAIGNWNASSVLITVLDITPPIADAGPNQTILQGATVTFDASKSNDNEGIVLYSWDFGEGTSRTGVTVTHTYSNLGTYAVTLTVKDAAGNTGAAKITINVISYFEANKWWIVVLSVAIVASIIGLFAWRIQKRKKNVVVPLPRALDI